MPHEAREPSCPDLASAAPSAAARERVLGRCRQELAMRHARARRWRGLQRWSLAVSVAGLLLLNLLQEHRSATRIASLVAGRGPIVRAPAAAPPPVGSLRARATLLAALLRDPSAL
jgi:hypothetical protein